LCWKTEPSACYDVGTSIGLLFSIAQLEFRAVGLFSDYQGTLLAVLAGLVILLAIVWPRVKLPDD
jgi:hypothetical protein